jgi:hypothetical protein
MESDENHLQVNTDLNRGMALKVGSGTLTAGDLLSVEICGLPTPTFIVGKMSQLSHILIVQKFQKGPLNR